MRLHDFFSDAPYDTEILSIENDSRNAEVGVLFVAYAGFEKDLHVFVPDAYRRGCRYFVVSDSRKQEFADQFPDALFFGSDNLPKELSRLVLEFYAYPDRKLCLIGVTGTNGKTTTATLIDTALRNLGEQTAFFGTTEWRIGLESLPALNTTPDLLTLVRMLKSAEDSQIKFVIMEVSSHALSLGRVEGLAFDCAIFTNLTQDHLDFHETIEDYFLAKRRFFTDILGPSPKKNKKAFINADCPYGQQILQVLGERGVPSESFSLENAGSLNALVYEISAQGSRFEVSGETLSTSIPGLVNVYNTLAAYAVLKYLQFNQAAEALESVQVPGRMQKLTAPDRVVFVVDYAHTPDALKQAVAVLKMVQTEDTRLITVFGSGGDRDKTKRPLMAQAVLESDAIIVTSDNPRTEDPQSIIDDILGGFPKMRQNLYVEPDRAKAVHLAYSLAEPGDIVLVAGKGHEKYQIIGTEKIYFSDEQCIQNLWGREGGL
ncbi:UDP-N-acetylmuramoylalanyl-D-glutamate--2,6-diaminopimelate ligase [Brevinema andersonii]|uniref:UDP-N-acetylmuramoyl-L-alanyl-D-glutamate--2,6-diaminopimelate ligase n=1 Tax=Brevinema andersonii TaxID=34097 RepID=A0A1I1D0U9_BREAD|nr:UDP-N-acetylmuramoyl-L-alanyl-D-glutamate--2,6-diaminopimelate ligase [Brevinema andersonii]SFB67946.1 UDP-N-acetylmuramoylalanyl-D-glutamate--2,6-diaminopimelate ligase [Brevinema andersonii]